MAVDLTEREQERAAVVAWLRNLTGAECMMMPLTIADAIERGEHIGKE